MESGEGRQFFGASRRCLLRICATLAGLTGGVRATGTFDRS